MERKVQVEVSILKRKEGSYAWQPGFAETYMLPFEKLEKVLSMLDSMSNSDTAKFTISSRPSASLGLSLSDGPIRFPGASSPESQLRVKPPSERGPETQI